MLLNGIELYAAKGDTQWEHLTSTIWRFCKPMLKRPERTPVFIQASQGGSKYAGIGTSQV